MAKTIEEINKKIKEGKAVVCTAEEIIDVVKEQGLKNAAKKIDVVTTGTFGPMCSSGVFLNLGHTKPKIKITKAWLNGVEACCGLAAVDLYIGATRISDDILVNTRSPRSFKYGGGHLIEDLVAGKRIELKASSYGTDEYPRKELSGSFTIDEINDAFLFNPRNCYQNYNVAVNTGRETIYTYMGPLNPDLGNANYCSAGQVSPLLNDPYYRTIGLGTRIFLAGGVGYVAWHGTQHDPAVSRNEKGIPKSGAGTIAVIGDLKQMKPEWLRGTSIVGYGVSLTVGIGIPIPILDQEILKHTCVTDRDILAPVVDYSYDYPEAIDRVISEVDYHSLKSGVITIKDRKVPTCPISSYPKAVEICRILKEWIEAGRFFLTEPVVTLPQYENGVRFRPFRGRYK